MHYCKSHTLREALTKGFGGTRAQKRSAAALRGCIYEKFPYVTPALGPLRKGQFQTKKKLSEFGTEAILTSSIEIGLVLILFNIGEGEQSSRKKRKNLGTIAYVVSRWLANSTWIFVGGRQETSGEDAEWHIANTIKDATSSLAYQRKRKVVGTSGSDSP
ncbi:hypothetical protein C8R45DRAFT_1079078 [Mycena sanguinolenta]|nr:hypothetical protein C8R45DRAFT_1079078 [Mycena sanguinolenta]